MNLILTIDDWHHGDNKDAIGIDNLYVILLDPHISDDAALICKHNGLKKAGHVPLQTNNHTCSTCQKKVPDEILDLTHFVRSTL